MSDLFSDSELTENQTLEDLDSCLGYLKKREVFLYKMMNDPNHKAMLYFLEVLLNSDRAVMIDDLVDKFYCKNFTQDMREACGNNSLGLKQFLERYPSLFSVNGGLVSAVSIDMPSNNGSCANTISNCSSPPLSMKCFKPNGHHNSSNSETNTDTESSCTNGYVNGVVKAAKGPVKFDINKETEAIRFFQNKMQKRDEKWVPIKSLAGHLSQANSDIRDVVGPQLDFRKFLLRNPHIFEIQGELVSLRDFALASHHLGSSTSSGGGHRRSKPHQDGLNGFLASSGSGPGGAAGTGGRPKSLNFGQQQINGFLSLYRDGFGTLSAPTTPLAHTNAAMHLISRTHPLTMTSNEYRAVIYLRKVIEKKNNSMSLSNLFLYLAKSSETTRNVIGWTRFELQEFIRKNSVFFDLTPNEMVVNRRAEKVNVIITGASNTTDCGTRTLTNRSGSVFHVAKLWGIIDLGKHEHVFFDKSIFKHLDDLQRHFKVGETLYFNAILAPKESRAKWRATQVWKECDREMVEKFCGGGMLHSGSSLSAALRCPLNGVNGALRSDDLASSIATDDLDGRSYCYHHNGTSEDDDEDVARILPDEVEAELARILQLTRSSGSELDDDDDDDEDDEEANSVRLHKNKTDTSSIPASPDFSCNRSIHSDPSISCSSHPLSAPAAPSNHYNNNSASINPGIAATKLHQNTLADPDKVVNEVPTEERNGRRKTSVSSSTSVASSSSPSSVSAVSLGRLVNTIGTQTLSTGDIMATNLFHE